MKRNIIIIIFTLLIVTIISYVIAFIGKPFIFVIVFPFALSFVFLTIIWSLINLIWMILPFETIKGHGTRFYATILACLILFFFGGWAINKYYLPYRFSAISLICDSIILLFTILIGWSLLNPNKKIIIFTGITGVALFLIIFVFARMNFPTNSKAHHSNSEALRSLPYLSYVVNDKNIEKDGVVTYNRNLCNKGINIYNSYGISGAYLLDLSGNILHTWLPKNSHFNWHYVEMYDKGDLLVIVKDNMLMRLDWNSNIKWAVKMRFHHDISIGENKDIYTLSRKDEVVFYSGLPIPILNDYIVILDPNGKIKKEISLYEILKTEISHAKLADVYHWIISPKNLKKMIKLKSQFSWAFKNDTALDIFHINTIEVIKNDINSVLKKGNIILCSKMLNLIGVIDIEKEKLLWTWGTNYLEYPHHPTLLANGNILIFDNGKPSRKYSRVIELNPYSWEVVWQYVGSPPETFFSSWGGASQRLPNENTLITDSVNGRIFEITKDGKIIWEFYNPIKDKNEKRATIYRMMRITDQENFPELEKFRKVTN